MTTDASTQPASPAPGAAAPAAPAAAPAAPAAAPAAPAAAAPTSGSPVAAASAPVATEKPKPEPRYVPLGEHLKLRRDYKALEGRIARMGEAMTGKPATPASTRTPEHEELRAQFLELFPEFKLLVEKGTNLEELMAAAPAIRQRAQSEESREATRVFKKAEGVAAEAFGLEKLDKDQTAIVRRNFIGWLEDDEDRAERFEQGDEELYAEFAKYLAAKLVDPVRRRQTVTEGDRLRRVRALPNAGPGNAPLGKAPETAGKSTEELSRMAFGSFQPR